MAGDGTAEARLEAWIAEHGDGLLRLCLLQLGDYALAEDAVQETFLRAYRAYARFEGRSSERTWLTAIALNVCRSLRRSARRRPALSLEEIDDLPAPPGGDGNYAVSDAVRKLPEELREVLLMHELQGLKLREIAELKRLPLPTVGARLRRAKARLRRELEGWYFDEA